MEKLNNEYFIKAYLEEVAKRSPGSYANNVLIIRDLTKNIEKPFLEMSMMDIQNYLITIIDKQEIKKSTKNSRRYMLKAFFDYIQKTMLLYKVDFKNPVPNKKIFKFTTNLDDIGYVADSELQILSLEELNKILIYCKKKLSLRDLVLILLVVVTGARISEIRTILRKDVTLDEYYFQTGFVPGARKTTLHTNKGLLFFFPKTIHEILRHYMYSCEKCDKWLFPGYMDKPLSRTMVQSIISKIRKEVGIHFTWHYFRRTLISERIKKGCPKWLSEGLANHAPSDVEAKSYIKLTIKDKRNYYRKYFPYKKITYFSNDKK
jgi:integrase